MPNRKRQPNEYIWGEDSVGILMSSGLVTWVDRSDFDLVSGHHWWSSRGAGSQVTYAVAKNPSASGPAHIRLHRVVLSALPGQLVDHIDFDGLNNRRSNLRVCGHVENTRHQRRITGQSGFRGVHWDRHRNRYRIGVTINGRMRKFGGTFTCPIEAAKAFDRYAREHYGEFAMLNFPEAS